jgi:1,2-diacylglycerol 3-alpha-glucosyltransferase
MISGAALAVQQLAEGMAARGHQVLVLAASERGYAYRTRAAGLRVARLQSFPNPFRVGQRFLPWLDRTTTAELHAFRPEILHLHDFSPVGLAGLRAVRGLKVPAVLTLHLLPPTLSAYAPPLPGLRQVTDAGLWAYYEWVAQQCQAVATPTRASADIVRAHSRCDPVVLPNGVQLARFSPQPRSPDEGERLRRKYRLDPCRPVIISVGRIDVEKRMDVVVRAAAQAMRSVRAQLLVVGDGTRRAATIRLSEELRIRDRCQFPGYVSAAGDLPGLYRLAVVFVMASEMETQGLAGLEAAASGLPVIAVRATALSELVQDGLNGYLVAPGDVEAMAEQMRLLLQNPEHARKMGEAARTLAERHSLESALSAHEQFYQSILSGSRN